MRVIGSLWVAVVIALVLAALWYAVAAVKQIRLAVNSANWQRTQGIVVLSEVRRTIGRNLWRESTSYSYPYVLYRYEARGKEYESTSIDLSDPDRVLLVEKLVERYPAGKQIAVYFNPEDPSQAVLEPGGSWFDFLRFKMSLPYLISAILFGTIFYFVKARVGLEDFLFKGYQEPGSSLQRSATTDVPASVVLGLELVDHIGDEAKVSELIAQGADVNVESGGKTPLVAAARNGSEKTARLLLESGAEIEFIDYELKTAFQIAVERSHVGIMKLLMEHGADTDRTTFKHGDTALIKAVRDSNDELARLLIKGGADLDEQNSREETAMILAVKLGRKDILSRLVEKGADVAIKDEDGKSALDYAGSDDSVRRLVKSARSGKSQLKNKRAHD